MGKKFLSFLGANNYGDTLYVLDTPSGQVTEESKYTQVVLLKNLCNSWDKSAKGYVFVTEEAKKANWESDDSTNTGKLKKQIEKLKEDGIINFEVEAIDIPRGFSQEEIWDIFDIVTKHIDEGDQIIFDITHGYRYLPMLEVVMLNFLKTTKNIDVMGIYYGVFETKSQQKPILNLTPFVDLLDLSFGINAFLSFGDGTYLDNALKDKKSLYVENEMQKLLKSGLDKRTAKKKIGEMFATHEQFTSMNKLINFSKALKNFTDSIFVLRGRYHQDYNKSISSAYKDLLFKMAEVKNLNVDYMKPLKIMLEKIEEKTARFNTDDNLIIGVETIKWCKEYSLVAEGYVALEETLVTHLCRLLAIDENNSDVRKALSAAATKKCRQNKNDIKTKNIYEFDESKKTQEIDSMAEKVPMEVASLLDKIKVKRNSVMHFGFTKEAIACEGIIKDFNELADEVLRILNKI